nr:MAG TPA: ribosomal protein [Caudoviricetes sp.]
MSSKTIYKHRLFKSCFWYFMIEFQEEQLYDGL